jgi:hypothetical protein
MVLGDALHTRPPVSIQIVDAGGEYVLSMKGNQSQPNENLRLWCGPAPNPIPS